ncbi:MAG: hypothetical protein AAFQ95_20060 [Cyanobacteria bacterium J06621_3]
MSNKRVDIALVGLLSIIVGITAFLFAPERTQDGLVHLYWNSFWSAQVLSGDWFPQWHAQGYGGFGNAAFIFYPPLSRYVALPYFSLGLAPITALKWTAATIAVINVFGAVRLGSYFFKSGTLSYRLLIVSLAINPYLFYCLFWRGAMAECLAIALVPFFLLATLHLSNQLSIKNGIAIAITTGLIAIAHVPTLIIIFFLFNGYSLLLWVGDRHLKGFLFRTAFFTLGLSLAAPYLGGIILNLSQIRQPTWYPIQDHFAFGKNFLTNRHNRIYSLIFAAYFVAYLLAIRSALKRRHQAKPHDIGLLVVLSGAALFMSQPLATPIYKFVPIIGKVQFPARFLAVTSTLVPTLAILSASLRFKRPKQQLSATFPFLVALCVPLYILYQSAVTPAYLSIGNKVAYSSAISERLALPAFSVTSEQPTNPSKKVTKIFKKDLVFFDDRLVVPDVVDYLPKSLKGKPAFWKFSGNTVMPAVAYQNHYLETGRAEKSDAQLQPTVASATTRRWQAQVTTPTTVELGITYFDRWQIQSIPAGMVLAKQPSERGLISVELAPGNYELIAEYKAGWSRGLILITLISIGIMIAFTAGPFQK